MNSSNTYNTVKEQDKNKPFFQFRSNRLIFLICILIATLFWLLIKLSDVYSVNYDFRVTYNNAPPDSRLTKVIDSTLNLNLTARGFAILKMSLFDDMENLNINLDSYTIENKGGIRYSISTQELTKKLAEIIGVSEKDIKFSKATLTFDMEKTSEKLVQVLPDYTINFMNQYDLYNDVRTDPNVIMVYGSQNILDTLSTIHTKKLILENVMTDMVKKVEITNPDPALLSFEEYEVSLHFKVEKFTESEITIPINLNNLEYKIKTFPSQVKVYYRVAQIDFNEVKAHQFNIHPVINNIDIMQANKLPLKLSKQPDFVRNVRIVPSDVEFLIIK
ncbi:MAG: hypothetical protein H8E34_08000 [Bacteroidetes bacterium]|nr:hypothetical protein [Bacteroidota bacterium]MBL6943652.1 hypothetical protein [Bacteroidales bacterium]